MSGQETAMEVPANNDNTDKDRVVGVRVIRWEDEKNQFGIAVEYRSGKHSAYLVGTWDEAIAEAAAIRARGN
jgi:hypothetical protein